MLDGSPGVVQIDRPQLGKTFAVIGQANRNNGNGQNAGIKLHEVRDASLQMNTIIDVRHENDLSVNLYATFDQPSHISQQVVGPAILEQILPKPYFGGVNRNV